MYPHQHERLTAALDAEGLDALVATTPASVFYLTGFRSLLQAVARELAPIGVFARTGTALVVPAIDVPTAVAERADVQHLGAWGRFAFAEPEGPDDEAAARIRATARHATVTAAEALAEALAALGVRDGTIALDEDGLTHGGWRHLVERLRGVTVVPGARALATARLVKGPWEIECLQRALGIAEEAVNAVLQMLEVGVTERQAADLFEAEVRARGGVPFLTTIGVAERSAFPCVPPSERTLRLGNLVRFDLGCTYRGYHADLGRTAVLGTPLPRQEACQHAIEQGLAAAVAAARPGVPASRLLDVAVEAVRAAGLPRFDRHDVGGGIGLDPVEPPRLAAGEVTTLEPGMVLRIDTPYYEPGWGGVHVKDTILVTRAGAHVLNRSHRGLVVLD